MLPIIMGREFIARSTKMPRSIEQLSASVSSLPNRSWEAFIINIAGSDFRYTHRSIRAIVTIVSLDYYSKALADALDLGRVQAVDFRATLPALLLAYAGHALHEQNSDPIGRAIGRYCHDG